MRSFIIVLLLCSLPSLAGASVRSDREDELKRLPNEYRPIAESCLSKGGYSCCMSAVRTMMSGDFPQAVLQGDEYVCPHGYSKHSRQCADTYYWCMPDKKKVTNEP